MKDYKTEALSRLINKLSEKERVKALIAALPEQLTIFEDTADQVKNERGIDLAIGIQLDKVGEIVGEPRMGRDDDEYRAAILFRIFVNVSKGRPSDLIEAVRVLTQADDVQYLESYSATAYLFGDGYAIDSDIQQQVQDVSPAAISDVAVAFSVGETPFRMSNGTTVIDDESELAGIQLGVLITLARQQLVTISGKRIRLRFDRQILPSVPRLNGVFQV